jgi:hypothetical protein
LNVLECPLELALPAGCPSWLATFVRAALAETTTLRENGAEPAVAARMAVLVKLVHAADAWLNEELDTATAAQERGCAEETIRRAVRGGVLPDRRANPHGHIKILRKDLHRVADSGPSTYDPIADAQDLARLRRKA